MAISSLTACGGSGANLADEGCVDVHYPISLVMMKSGFISKLL